MHPILKDARFTNDLRTLVNGVGVYDVKNCITIVLCTVPATSSFEFGPAVPMPTLPSPRTFSTLTLLLSVTLKLLVLSAVGNWIFVSCAIVSVLSVRIIAVKRFRFFILSSKLRLNQ